MIKPSLPSDVDWLDYTSFMEEADSFRRYADVQVAWSKKGSGLSGKSCKAAAIRAKRALDVALALEAFARLNFCPERGDTP
jgi:hypothetical protein